MRTMQIRIPEVLLLDPALTTVEVERRSQFLMGLKYFELGQLTSGQAAELCGLSRTAFLTEASRLGVAVADLSKEEMQDEFANA